MECDVTDPAQVQECVDLTVREHGTVDILVNNAHVPALGPLAEIPESLFEDGWNTGPLATFRFMRACRPHLEGGGVIVNIGSLSGVANVEKFPGLAAYNVSKAGLISLTEAVALEGRPHRIRCIALSPGAVDTEMLRRAAPHLTPGVTPEDIAALVAWLVREEAAPLSGVNIPVFSNA